MTRQLVFIHGRSQQGRTALEVKSEWLEALRVGLAKSNLKLPIAESDVRLPFYGDTLDQLVKGRPAEEVAKVVIRGENQGEEESQFVRAMILDIQKKAGISDAEVDALAGDHVITRDRGIQNWEWVQRVLMVLDRKIPYASGATVAIATRDVYLYLKNPGFSEIVDAGVKAAFTPDSATVVVAHSLGTVVAYRLLRSPVAEEWTVPLFVTLGSPLGVQVIRDSLGSINHPACVDKWFNAMDERDIVALYPLDSKNFPIKPPIENKVDVDNQTENRHGIKGYLSDQVVARRIYDALI